MRKSSVLDALFPAIRQQILAATLLEPEKWWYLTELASHLGTSPSSLQRELGALTRSGLLEHRQDGRRTYYKANTASPVFNELHELFGKTAGIIPTLQAEFIQFGGKVTRAFIYGSIAREKEQAHSDVDLMVIGSISTADLVPMLKRLEQSFQREINVTRYSEKEFKQKIQNKDHFLLSVLNEKVVMVKGAQDELEAAARAQHKVQLHTTSKQELDGLRALIERDLTDAALAGLSADRRFATAYNAALQTAKMVIACAGYRVTRTPGHHRLHFEAARIALGSSADRFLDYFETSRRKRNVIDYDFAFIATETEAEEILSEANKFNAFCGAVDKFGESFPCAHWLIMWGCIIAALITFPLVFGWLMFESVQGDLDSYRIDVFGFPTSVFKVESIFGFLLFHGLVWAAFLVIAGVMIAMHRRMRDEGAAALQFFREDILPLVLLFAVSLTGLLLTVSSTWLRGYGYEFLSITHAAMVIVTLLWLPFGKFFHIFQRPAQIGVSFYKDVARAEEAAKCRRCGHAFSSRMHVEDLIKVQRESGYKYEAPDDKVEHYQWICPRCRRALLALAQGKLRFPRASTIESVVLPTAMPAPVNPNSILRVGSCWMALQSTEIRSWISVVLPVRPRPKSAFAWSTHGSTIWLKF